MPDNEDIIRRGRDCIRLIEAVDVLVEYERTPGERIVLREARRLAIQRLRQIVKDFDPAVTAQIMVASDKRLGIVKDVMLN